MNDVLLKKRIAKFANKIFYAGNLRAFSLGAGKKLGLNKNAAALPPELIPYQIILNVLSLYVIQERRRLIVRPYTTVYLEDMEIVKKRFEEGYLRLEKQSASDSDNLEKMRKSYLKIQRAIRGSYPELEIFLTDAIARLEQIVS